MSWCLDPQLTSRQDRTYTVSWDEDSVRGSQQHPRSSNLLGRLPIMVYDSKKIQHSQQREKLHGTLSRGNHAVPQESQRMHLMSPATNCDNRRKNGAKWGLHPPPPTTSQVLPSSPSSVTNLPHEPYEQTIFTYIKIVIRSMDVFPFDFFFVSMKLLRCRVRINLNFSH